MATTDLKIVLEAQANLAGFTSAQTAAGALGNQVLATQRQITGQIQAQSAAQANVIRQAQQQQGLFSRIAASFKQNLGMPSGGVLSAMGGAAGAAAGGLLAGAAFLVVNAFRETARAGLALADSLNDLAEQMGIQAMDMLKLRTGAAAAGVNQMSLARGLGQFNQVRGQALAGDADALALLATYGITPEMLQRSGVNGLPLARQVQGSLGSAGALGRDDQAMRRLFGPGYRKFLAAMSAMPDTTDVTDEEIGRAAITAAAIEYADIKRDELRIKAAASIANPIKYALADSIWLYQANIQKGIAMQESAAAQGFGSGRRTAGFWTPQSSSQGGARVQSAGWDWSAPASGEGARRGLFASASDYRLWLSQTQVSKAMLAELKELNGVVRHALGAGIKWE